MDATYDGSTSTNMHDPLAGLERPEPPTGHESYAPAVSAHAGAGNGGGETSALAQLRERVAAKQAADAAEAEDERLWFHEIPGVGVRLVCDPDVENSTFQSWIKRANTTQGRAKRRRQQGGDGTDMDQLTLAGYALSESSVRIDMNHAFGTGREADWRPLADSHGEPMNLQTHELWREYNVLNSLSLLKVLYGRKADAHIINAGLEFLDETGYMGVDDPES